MNHSTSPVLERSASVDVRPVAPSVRARLTARIRYLVWRADRDATSVVPVVLASVFWMLGIAGVAFALWAVNSAGL